jgi:hypothetical protein
MGDVNLGGTAGVNVNEVHDIAPLDLRTVHNIAPVATHVKEINNIDPITVEGFNVTEIRNIDPLSVQEFNVTNLPHVNMSLRQLPPVDMNIRRIPPISVGINQNFRLPSRYSVSTRLLGLEVMRVTMQGETCIIPQDKYHREQSRSEHRSFAQPAASGNAAIPASHGPANEKPEGDPRAKLDAAAAAFSMRGGRAGFSVGNQGDPMDNRNHP